MINWEEYKKQSKKRKSKLSDEELIKTFNKEVGCGGWGTARMYHLHYLSKEIRLRDFNSDIIFDLDHQGNVKSMKLSQKVILLNNKLILIY